MNKDTAAKLRAMRHRVIAADDRHVITEAIDRIAELEGRLISLGYDKNGDPI